MLVEGTTAKLQSWYVRLERTPKLNWIIKINCTDEECLHTRHGNALHVSTYVRTSYTNAPGYEYSFMHLEKSLTFICIYDYLMFIGEQSGTIGSPVSSSAGMIVALSYSFVIPIFVQFSQLICGSSFFPQTNFQWPHFCCAIFENIE